MTTREATSNRALDIDNDIPKITQFLLDTYRINQTLHNWEPRRWQGLIYHNDDEQLAEQRAALGKQVRIWEDADGAILGIVIPESRASVYLQVHPDARTIEPEMIAWAEANLSVPAEDGGTRICLWAYAFDMERAELLWHRGYVRSDYNDITRRRAMSTPILDVPAPAGYTVRAMTDSETDRAQMGAVLNAAFNSTANTAQTYANFQRAPIYDPETDMVVEGPDGTLVATAGFTYHTDYGFGILEPVATHPDHEGRKLAQAAISEGLRRLQAKGIDTVYVGAGGDNPASNHVYDKLGFTDVMRCVPWDRTWS